MITLNPLSNGEVLVTFMVDVYEPNGYGQTHGALAESLQVPHTATKSPSHEPRTKQRSPVSVTAS